MNAFKRVFVFFLVSIAAFQAQAQTDDFNDGNDTGWTRYNPLGNGTFTFPGAAYQITAGVSPNPLLAGPGRAGSVRTGVNYSDFSITYDVVNWNNTLNQAFGALARVVQLGAGTTDGYSFTYSTGGSINISRINNEGPTGLGSAAITLNPANDYRFVFTGTGSNFVGRVFDLSNLVTPLATALGADAAFASGDAGFVVFDNTPGGTGTADATFDNYVAVVPEPSSVALLLVGGAGLFMFRRKFFR